MKKLPLRLRNARLFALPALALVGLLTAISVVRAGNEPKPIAQPITIPASAPFESYVSGSGTVEGQGENISIAAHRAGVVDEISVSTGADVKAGDLLFRIDARAQEASVAVAEGALHVAEARAQDARAQLQFVERLSDKRAVSADEESRRRFALAAAEATVKEAAAMLYQSRTELDLLSVRAPRDGRIIRINIRPGEFAPTASTTPLMVLATSDKLWVRADIDENDAWRVHPGARAVASLRGNRSISTPLRFVRFEPYVIPKRSLTGDNSERVDTRVLQIVFEFEPGQMPVYVGQLMDVFIEAQPHA